MLPRLIFPLRSGAVKNTKLTRVSSLALGFIAKCDAGTTVHHDGLFGNEPIRMELVNVATTVSESNFIGFGRVHPNLALSAFENIRREALLQFKGN